MNNIIVLPLIMPIITGILLVFLREQIKLQRIISLMTLLFVAGASAVLLQGVYTNGIMRLDFSGWAPPYGILFVADPFAVMLVLTASIVTASVRDWAHGQVFPISKG